MRAVITLLIYLFATSSYAQSHIYNPIAGPVRELQGDRHSNYCALDYSNLLTCWSAWGEPTAQPPKDLGPVMSVSVGGDVSCAIRMDNSVICWGEPNTYEGMVFLPEQLQFARSISIQDNKGCGIALDGAAYCWNTHDWGDEDEGHEFESHVHQLPQHYDGFDTIHVTINGACMTSFDGRADCWNERLYQFHMVPPKSQVKKISIDDWATGCALMKSGKIECFGSNYDGTFDPDGKVEPVPKDLGHAKDLALGRVNACAISEQGFIMCWSMCAKKTCFYDGVSTPPREKAQEISIGIENGCAVMEDRTVTCWETPEDKKALLR